MDLEVEVAAGGVAAGAHLAELLPGPDRLPALTSSFCMWAYQVATESGPVTTLTSHVPAHAWSVSISTVPLVAARTGVPHGTEKSVPVCQLPSGSPLPPQLWLSVPTNAGGTG